MIAPFRLGVIASAIRADYGDVNFSRVILLLHMDGANNATSFPDSSVIGTTMSASGQAKLTTAGPKFGSAAATFDGAGDSVNGTNANFALGTADFTIEFWCFSANPAAGQVYSRLIQTGPNATQGGVCIVRDNNTSPMSFLVHIHTGTAFYNIIVGTLTAPNSTWNHIAVTRTNGVWRLFVNGQLDGEATYTGLGNNLTQTALYIGANATSLESFAGLIDEVRITAGLSRYTAAFTPPSQAFPDYSPQWDRHYASVVLSLHGNGASGSTTIVDSSYGAKSMVANGNAAISTAQSKFGGSSLVFDGSGDWVQTATNLADFRFGTGDFTVEGWINTSSANRVIFDAYGTATANCWQLFIDPSGQLLWYSNDGVSAVAVATATGDDLRTGTWRHVAACRSGTTLRLFVDGVERASVTDSRNYNATAVTQLAIGAQVYSRNATYDFLGYMDDLRITKGVARYTAAFVPQTYQNPDRYFAWTNVSTWLDFNGTSGSTTFVDDGPRPKTFSASGGSAALSTTQAFAGSASLAISGSSYVSCPDHADFQFGTGDFTIECRIWCATIPTTGSNYAGICGRRTSSGSMSYILYLNGDNSGAARFDITGGGAAIGPVPIAGQWNHIAVSRSNGFIRVFVNGVAGTPYNIGTGDITAGSFPFHIGQLSLGVLSYPLNGYIDNLRVVKGIGLYVADFTAPFTT